MDESKTCIANTAGKMRIDSLVSAQSISPTAPKAASWRAANGEQHQHQIRPLHMLLIEAKRAALEDEFIEKRREQASRSAGASCTTTSLDQPQLRPAAPLSTISPSSTTLRAISAPSSSSSSFTVKTSTSSASTGVLNKRIFSRGLHVAGGSSSSIENLSFSVLNRANLPTASKPVLRLASGSSATEACGGAAKENVINCSPDVEMKMGATASISPVACQQQQQPKLLKLSFNGAGQQRRPLTSLTNNHPTLTRTHSFPPASSPSTPSRSSTLNVRKRSLEASPSTAASARILVQSLPNVKIHVQKKIKLMPRPAGQVQSRPEGVKNVLVYHF